MAAQNPVFGYTVNFFKKLKSVSNETETQNVINREFSNRKPYGVIVSDLTYVRVKDRWGYVCVILDVHSQKIIDLAYGPKQSADLVPDAFARVTPLHARIYFHTDRGRK